MHWNPVQYCDCSSVLPSLKAQGWGTGELIHGFKVQTYLKLNYFVNVVKRDPSTWRKTFAI